MVGLMTSIAEPNIVRNHPFPTRRWVMLGIVLFLSLLVIGSITTYNRLVTLDQGVQASWAEVENTYQRRADLVPNLVNTVRGAAAFESETLLAVTAARTRVTQASGSASGRAPGATPTASAEAFANYQQAQDGLSTSLSRLMVVVERYPDLRATQNFRDLQSQLEGTENRIAVARMRFNEAAQAFNAKRSSFPTVLIVNIMGNRFRNKPYFAAAPGAQSVPNVDFNR